MMLSKQSIEIVDLLISNHIDSPVVYSCFSAIATRLENFFFNLHYFPVKSAPSIAMQKRDEMAREMLVYTSQNSLITTREKRRAIDNLTKARLRALRKKGIIFYDKNEQQWRVTNN